MPGLLWGFGTLLLLRSMPSLLLGLSWLGGWGIPSRLSLLLMLLLFLLLLLLLLLCACRNCDPKEQEQKCGADHCDWLHFFYAPN
jgi:hypothetical protein